ncbi:HAD family hydrolase [Edaphobacter bradus]|uniref:HAD family hydrolase n=1 Tax=Edaphobacter bradus TaxID=2259016 RepID=UPI0021E0C6D1|nr:HAD family phosphatase [Edaphobacter bradus]
MNPIQAVLFDYGMVLSGPPDPAAWQRMRAISDLSEEALHAGYWAYRHDYDRDTLNARAYWAHVASHAETTFTPEQINGLIAADLDLWGELNPPMLTWAQSLQRAGVRTGILSNIGDAMSEGLLARFDWLSAFNHCTWSYALKLAKPEPAIYHAAAQGLATSPANILFVDDRAENVEAARATGMQAIQYSHADHPAFEQEMRSLRLDYLLDPASSPTST